MLDFLEDEKNEDAQKIEEITADVEIADVLWYNEITLSSTEYARLHSEALTWGPNIRNKLTSRTLSNGISYLYVLDSDAMLHVYRKKKTSNFHKRREFYDQRNRKRFDMDFKELRVGQRNHGVNFDSLQNGREQTENDRRDIGTIRENGGGLRGVYTKTSVGVNRRSKTGISGPFLPIVHTFVDLTLKNLKIFMKKEFTMLTQIEKNLIDLLKSFRLDKETTVAISVLCETDKKRQQMIDEIISLYHRRGEVTEQNIKMLCLMLTGDLKPEYRDRFCR